MSELQLQIQQQLDSAQPSDIIQLPPHLLDFPIIISKPCTVVGTDGTMIDVSGLTEEYAIKIIADNVTFSDVKIRNKTTNGFNGVYVKSNQSSIERLDINADICLYVDKSNNIDIIELKTYSATTGIKINDSMNMDIDACIAYNCAVGLDIVGSSSVQGDIDSYQGFGLNIQATDITSLIADNDYEFKLDGMLFSFKATQNMTYQDLVNTLNAMTGFNPVYTASILNNDVVIKTSNEEINLESSNNARSMLSDLCAVPSTPTNNISYSYLKFGLTINENDLAPIEKGVVYTFLLDGNEIQFYSPETDGTTYAELVALILQKITTMGYIIEIKNNDIVITKPGVPSIIMMNGTRFKNLVAQLGITIQKSVYVIESTQKLGLTINDINQPTPLIPALYSIIVNGVEYTFNNVASGLSYQQLVSLLNGNTTFKAKYTVSINNGDILFTANAPSILVEPTKLNLFIELNTTPKAPVTGSEESRTDRSHHIDVINSLIYENGIGVRLVNANNVSISEGKIFSNTNIGIWQMPSSYNNKFRGEIYNNKNYGLRNTDRSATIHDFDARETWWGDMTGPSMFGKGEGDKISANIVWEPSRQNGTIPDLSYPKTRAFVLGALGYPLVKVELSDEQIKMCIDKAIDKYMQYRKPEPIYRYVTANAGSAFVKLPLDMPKEEIIEVVYTPNADIFSQLSGSGESFYMTYYLQNTGGTFLSDFYVAMAYRETMETTLGIRPTYELVSGKDIDGSYCDYLRLSPVPERSLTIGILFSRPLSEAEVDNISWIHKYSLCWAKEILGRIRSKYGSVPGPTGEMQLDGGTLLSEHQQEITSLEEQLLLQDAPLGFSVG